MLTLSKLDAGWFGKGMYFTHFPAYASKYGKKYYVVDMIGGATATTAKKVLLLCWVVKGLIYPVVEDPKGSSGFLGKPCMSGFHSHYVIVKNYMPCGINDRPDSDEIVIFQEDQILPRCILLM